MTHVSVGEAWAMSVETFRRDGQLMLPVTLALVGLPGMIFSLAIPAEQINAVLDTGQPAPWMLLLIPILLIGLLNALAVAAMVLVPRISVGEALRLGGRRLPALVGAISLLAAAGMAAGLIAQLVAAFSPAAGAAVVVAAALAMVVAGVRLILLPPVVVSEELGAIGALRRAWRLSAGSFWRLLAFVLIVVFVNLLLDLVVVTAGGAIVQLVGRIADAPGLATVLAALMAAIATSAVALLIVVMTANLYRQLTAGCEPAAVLS